MVKFDVSGPRITFKYCFILLLSVAAVAVVAFYIFCLPRQLFTSPLSTVAESSDGRLMGARIAADGQWRFPPADSVPEKFAKALLTFEDKRFYSHPGIDILAVGRAVEQNISRRSVVSGASTITMQVMRMSRRGKGRSVYEKAVEAVMATRLELSCSKDEILAMYASNAPFGGNVVGLGAASWRYFGRSPDNLSWAEAATLAVLPNSPSLIHVARNRDRLQSKRDALLDKMHSKGIISGQELDLAKSEPLPDKPLPLPMLAPHLTDRITRERGNIIARTTLDYDMQQRVNGIVESYAGTFSSNLVNNMAVLVADVRTGETLAYVGNVSRSDSKYGSNVDVVTAPRSSGSILKPLLYAAMLDEGDILPGTLIPDVPFHYETFSPRNFNRTFDGAVPAHRVLERSLNVPIVRMLQSYGMEKFHALLRRSGFTTITRTPDHYGLTLVLGGAECTLWDVVSVYSGLAAKMNTLEDPSLPVMGVHYLADGGKAALSENDVPFGYASLWLTLESLSNLNRPEEEMDWQSFTSSRKVAWKTGTSYGNRDAWSIGVTPGYVVGVWVGNADGEGRPGLTGIGYAAPVMFDVFSILPRTGWFGMPQIDMEHEAVCRRSGHLASGICPEVDSLWIPSAGLETVSCPYHIEINLSRDGRYRVNSDCASVSDMKRVPWFVLPPAQEWYYKSRNADYKPLPPVHPGCASYPGEHPLELIYPQRGMTVIIPRRLDSGRSGVVFRAAHRDPSSTVFWHIDDRYVASTTGDHHILADPAPGRHVLTLVDTEGNSLRMPFRAE